MEMPYIHCTDRYMQQNIFRQVEQINIADMIVQKHGYFWLLGIRNVNTPLQTLWYYHLYKT